MDAYDQGLAYRDLFLKGNFNSDFTAI